jgi:putative endonuclease
MFKTLWVARRALHPGATSVELGSTGEKLAARFLKESGYQIVATNFAAPIGRGLRRGVVTGEIDIVAYDVETPPFPLSFIEVKTRTTEQIIAPEAAVDMRKQRQLIRTSRVYRALMNLEDVPYRYDVVSVLMFKDEPVRIQLYRGFFSERRQMRQG